MTRFIIKLAIAFLLSFPCEVLISSWNNESPSFIGALGFFFVACFFVCINTLLQMANKWHDENDLHL